MGTERRTTWNTMRGRWAAAIVLLFAGFSAGQGAFAATIGAATPGFDEAEHARHCTCGELCRKAACCCEPTKRSRAQPATRSIQISMQGNARPCISAAPCGLPGSPTSRHAGSMGKPAVMFQSGGQDGAEAERLCVAAPRCILPKPWALRLEEPPEDRVVG